MSAPRPARVSHLLVADDALISGRWGVHLTLFGLEVRRPSATAAEQECCPGYDCDVTARRINSSIPVLS